MQKSDKENNVCLPTFPPPQPLGLALLGNRLFVFLCLRASTFDANRETSAKFVLDMAEKRRLALAPVRGAWPSLQFPQSSQWPFSVALLHRFGRNLPMGLGAVFFHGLVFSAGVISQGSAERSVVTQLMGHWVCPRLLLSAFSAGPGPPQSSPLFPFTRSHHCF